MTGADVAAALLETTHAFRPRLLEERDGIEANCRLPAGLARDLAEAGLFRLSLPAAYGGHDLAPIESMAIFEELGRTDASVAWCVWNGNTYWTAPLMDPAGAREIFSHPTLIGANSTQPRGQAHVVEGGYRVSGRWSLVSGCQISDWVHLTCIVYQGDAPRLTPAGTPQVRLVYCRAADCEIVDTWNAGGLRGTGSHDVVVRDLFVPERHASALTDPPALSEPKYRYPSLSRIVPGCGALALGIARGAIETLVDLGGAKRPDRSSHLLSEDRGAQTRLAQAEALVSSARLFLLDAVGTLWDHVAAGGEPAVEGRARVRLAVWNAVSSAAQAVDLVYLTGGATSLYVSSPLERAFRDVHAMTQHIAAQPRNLETVGRVLFGLEPDTPML